MSFFENGLVSRLNLDQTGNVRPAEGGVGPVTSEQRGIVFIEAPLDEEVGIFAEIVEADEGGTGTPEPQAMNQCETIEPQFSDSRFGECKELGRLPAHLTGDRVLLNEAVKAHETLLPL
jgi:hypothetical protein